MLENTQYSTYDVVPAGYDLLSAPPEKLDLYGIPQKPDAIAEPAFFEFWKKLVSHPFSAKQPTFSDSLPPSRTTFRSFTREGTRAAGVVPSHRGNLESSLNWSGAVMSPPWPKRIVCAVGGWNAPDVRPPTAQALFTHSNESKALAWVGIDGHNGRLPKISMPQIGTAHAPGTGHFAWWYWWSHSNTSAVKKIDDFPVAPGNEILAGLVVLASEDVLYFIKNQSTGAFRSFLGRVFGRVGDGAANRSDQQKNPPAARL
jgi:Peptidase A4 family